MPSSANKIPEQVGDLRLALVRQSRWPARPRSGGAGGARGGGRCRTRWTLAAGKLHAW